MSPEASGGKEGEAVAIEPKVRSPGAGTPPSQSEPLIKPNSNELVGADVNDQSRPALQPHRAEKQKKSKSGGKRRTAAEDAAKAKEEAANSADVFGEPGVCMSASMTARRWTSVGAVGPHLIGSDVWVRARVHAVRAKGNLAFVVLRQGCFTVQGVASAPAIPKAMVAFLGKIPSESIVDVEASVASAQVLSLIHI